MTAPSADGANETAYADLAAVARVFEPERYLAATLAQEPARAALIAIAAYAADLQRIAATATQPMLAEIRLQWWRDALDGAAAGERTGSPLADAVTEAVRQFDLPVGMLVAVSEARAFDLYDDPMPDAASLDGYLAKTEAIPFELALRVTGLVPAEAAALALPAGRVFGLARLLARLPVHLAHGRHVLPAWEPEKAQALVSRYADEVRTGFASLEPQFRRLPQHQRCALLPLAVVPSYLRCLGRRGRDPQRDGADLAPLTRAWRIGLAYMTGRI